MNGIHLFKGITQPVSGRHIRSPMGMHSISVGYKEASKIRSAVGAAFIDGLFLYNFSVL